MTLVPFAVGVVVGVAAARALVLHEVEGFGCSMPQIRRQGWGLELLPCCECEACCPA